MRQVPLLVALALLSGLAAPRAAQADPGMRLMRLQPAAGGPHYFQTYGSQVLEHLQVSGSLTLDYANLPLRVVDEQGKELAQILEGQTVLHGTVGLGFADRFELSLGLPMVLAQSSGDLSAAGRPNESIAGSATGDFRIVPRVALLDNREGGPGLSLFLSTSVPTGSAADFVSEAGVTFLPGLAADFRFAPHGRVGLNAGYLLRGAGEFLGKDIGDELSFGFGAEVPLGGESLSLLADLFGGITAEGQRSLSSQEVPLEYLLGVRWYGPAGITLSVGAGSGLTQGFGNPSQRVVAQLSLGTPSRSRDPDGDRILGDDDACPFEAEDFDGIEDHDGCPDLDHDQDGVLEPNDRCPDEPEDRDGFKDKDGCPDPDNDKDGLLDARDRCPNEAEDKDGFEDEDGCPDPDNDQDGIRDKRDRCPNEPEDMDGYEDSDGCPDDFHDRDRDGIADSEDRCPDEPETINGNEDEDGCPDRGIRRVEVTLDQIRILDKVFFDTGKATIKKRSYSLLNQVAQTLRAYPQIRLVEVQGHTDDVGDDDDNLRLSQARAESVVNYLLGKRVAVSRLQMRGYGETRPLEDIRDLLADPKAARKQKRKIKAARANNRRVEFHILQQDRTEEREVEVDEDEEPSPQAPATESGDEDEDRAAPAPAPEAEDEGEPAAAASGGDEDSSDEDSSDEDSSDEDSSDEDSSDEDSSDEDSSDEDED